MSSKKMGRSEQKHKATTTYTSKGSAIEGPKILYNCRKQGRPYVVNGSSKHRSQGGWLENAYCVIEISFELIK